jgi:hypothetical protein
LSDAEKRRQYDEFGHDGHARASRISSEDGAAHRRRARARGRISTTAWTSTSRMRSEGFPPRSRCRSTRRAASVEDRAPSRAVRWSPALTVGGVAGAAAGGFGDRPRPVPAVMGTVRSAERFAEPVAGGA